MGGKLWETGCIFSVRDTPQSRGIACTERYRLNKALGLPRYDSLGAHPLFSLRSVECFSGKRINIYISLRFCFDPEVVVARPWRERQAEAEKVGWFGLE